MNRSLSHYYTLLVDYLRPQRARVLWLALLTFTNVGLQLINPQIMRRFIDSAIAGSANTGSDTNQLTMMALLFIVIALAQQIAAVGATYVGENVAWTATNLLRYDLARHCLYLDMSFHNKQTPGAMIERIDGDINTLSEFFSQFVLQVLGNGLLLLGVLVLLFRENLYVGLALTIFVVVTLFVLNRLRDVAVPHWKKSREASANYFGFLEERLAGTEDIRASGAKAYTMRRFFELLRTFWQTTVRARLLAFAMVNIGWTLFGIGTAVAFIVSASLFQNGTLTIGAVYLVVHYTGMLSRPIERIAQEIEKLQQAGAGVARIQELLDVQNQLSAPTQPNTPSSGPLAVTFEDISFAYPADSEEVAQVDYLRNERVNNSRYDFALRNINFQLESGKVMGLLGRTGSGKTTLARLLFRLYDPTDGSILIGEHNVRNVPIRQLRQRIGMVTQNVQLFHASVRNNLTFFDDTIPDAEILRVLDDLGLTRWLETLDAGLDNVLAAGGGNLSAGEAQLLAFTRIFLKDPGLIIFDEASSRLDPATEQLIERAVDRLLHNRTAIIIAHRLATVQRADEIMILDNGHILEHGPRTALAADPDSHFAQLLRTGMAEVLA